MQAPKTRADRATKLTERRQNNETVVKCSLGAVIPLDVDTKTRVVQQIEKRVLHCSKRSVICSIVLNKILKSCFHGVDAADVSQIAIPDIFNVTFIRQAMLGTESAQKDTRSVTLQTFFEENITWKQNQQNVPRNLGDRNIYSAAAIKYLTNLKNHYTTNIGRWIKRIMYSENFSTDVNRLRKLPAAKQRSLKKKDIFKALLFHMNGWKSKDKENAEFIVGALSPNTKEVLAVHHTILGGASIDEKWMKNKDNLIKMVRYCAFMNITMGEKERKTNLAPVLTIRRHFTTFDKSTIYGILKDAKAIDEKVKSTDIEKNPLPYWKILLNWKKVQGRGKTFTGTIESDGVSVCVHFSKPKAKMQNKRKAEKRNAKKAAKRAGKVNRDITSNVGCDPGRSNIFFMVAETSQKIKSFRLTRNQYYVESGIIRARRNTRSWQGNRRRILNQLSAVSSKGVDMAQFLRYETIILQNWVALWSDMTSKMWSKQRLRLYGGKKKVFAQFFNKLRKALPKDKKIVVAYGAAKVAPGGAGEMSVPTCRGYKECCARVKTVPISEFRTTKIYNRDKETVLMGVKRKDTGHRVRGLLWCRSTKKESKFINRDLNAAMNILHCHTLPTRPKMLCRTPGMTRLQDVVGKIINS
jgi:hypothetical protein